MTITPKQRKAFWIAVAALAVIYYGPSLITTVHSTNTTKPSPFVATPALPPPAFRGLLGNYNGKALLARGLCALHFELRADREHPGSFMAASVLGCTPLVRNPWAARTTHVTSVVLSGSAASEDIPFKITDTITADCEPTAFTAKPFGMSQLIVHWEDSCKGGTMIVNRGGN
jgi:hypothetical protein